LSRRTDKNIQDIFVQGKNPDYYSENKKVIQRTPISSNLKNYIENVNFETPVNPNNSSKNIFKFATPSSGGESLTTATSMRKLSQRISPN